MNTRSVASGALACAIALCTTAAPTWAQDEEKSLGWTQSAELSLVAIAGNAESQTFGLKSSFVKTTESSTLALSASGLRAESTATSRVAAGLPPYTILETSTTTLTAESYSASGRYDHLLSERLFWYAGLGWERNEFAGLSRRLTGVGGVGHLWWERGDSRFRTDYGLTWTSQDNLVSSAGVKDSFLGARLSYDYWRRLTASAEYASVLILDQNLDETEDLRADFTNSVSISISDRLALKVSLQALYDNLPALGLVPVVDAAGTPTGVTVPYELEELDTIFTTALVVNF